MILKFSLSKLKLFLFDIIWLFFYKNSRSFFYRHRRASMWRYADQSCRSIRQRHFDHLVRRLRILFGHLPPPARFRVLSRGLENLQVCQERLPLRRDEGQVYSGRRVRLLRGPRRTSFGKSGSFFLKPSMTFLQKTVSRMIWVIFFRNIIWTLF